MVKDKFDRDRTFDLERFIQEECVGEELRGMPVPGFRPGQVIKVPGFDAHWPKVYLAGPITGKDFAGATDWRFAVKHQLESAGIKTFSPMRAKEYLKQLKGPISGTGEEYAHLGVLSLPRGVITRDRFDCTRSDVILVNLLGADRVSSGTLIEFGWADGARRPIVCAIEEKGNPHEHMMVSELIGYRVPTLEEAVHVVKAILL